MTTALYRRYRPESFAEVIGQDHVTAPLRQALRSGQTNHAYLFSGPRGCGKTTSARILARCLNCAQGPTDTPCGVCPSCVELARGGPGSLDVVEIDAASHGGVDDARELRERATFAPARDRYKIFILDEAHMVSPQGFNALLKIVEEPPPHVKFVFATTEPDKVIGTIRSRTHHYPFRLVPPDVLVPYLEQLCTTERVPVGAGVLSLVVRAGGGSVRDTLSVLDQLVAGAGEQGIEYEGAVALLGYTHGSLLDDLVEAVAARDGASAFRVVERVIATGHEPRRFVEDLLERLRDLIVIAASGEAAGAVLRDLPADQMERMRAQATHLGMSELSRSADLANTALTEMVGATSPRLHLELLMARLLLPATDDSRAGLGARIDRLERGLPAGPAVPAVAAAAVPRGVAPGAPAVAADRAVATDVPGARGAESHRAPAGSVADGERAGGHGAADAGTGTAVRDGDRGGAAVPEPGRPTAPRTEEPPGGPGASAGAERDRASRTSPAGGAPHDAERAGAAPQAGAGEPVAAPEGGGRPAGPSADGWPAVAAPGSGRPAPAGDGSQPEPTHGAASATGAPGAPDPNAPGAVAPAAARSAPATSPADASAADASAATSATAGVPATPASAASGSPEPATAASGSAAPATAAPISAAPAPAPTSAAAASGTAAPVTAPPASAAPALAPTSAGSAISAPDPAPARPAPGAVAAAADTEMLRRRWPDVLTTLRRLRVPSWALVNQHAQVLELDATTLRLGFLQPGLVTTFKNSGHGEVVARALHETLGVGVRVEAVLSEPGAAPARSSGTATPAVPEVPATISRERAAASWDLPATPAPAAAPAPGAGAPGRSAGPGATRTDAAPGADRPGGAPPHDAPPHDGPAAARGGPADARAAAAPADDSPARSGGAADDASRRSAAPGDDAARRSAAPSDDDIPPGPEPEDPWASPPPDDAPAGRPSAPSRSAGAAPTSRAAGSTSAGATSAGPSAATPDPTPTPVPASAPTSARERGLAAARAAQSHARTAEPDEPSPDDPPIASSGLVGAPLVMQVLGGRVIDEQVDGGGL